MSEMDSPAPKKKMWGSIIAGVFFILVTLLQLHAVIFPDPLTTFLMQPKHRDFFQVRNIIGVVFAAGTTYALFTGKSWRYVAAALFWFFLGMTALLFRDMNGTLHLVGLSGIYPLLVGVFFLFAHYRRRAPASTNPPSSD
jgi:hypothetical protein